MILVTRPLAQVDKLQILLREVDLDYVLFPAFEVKKLTPKISSESYDVIIFISVNAVIYAHEYLPQLLARNQKIFAVGPATANKLMAVGVQVDAYPKENASSAALLALTECQSINNKKILIVRGQGGAESLKNELQVSNQVDYIEVYERRQLDVSELHQQSIERFMEADKGVVLANSNQTLLNTLTLVEAIDPNQLDHFKQYPLLVISERIKTYALSLGFGKVHIAPDLGDKEVLSELLRGKM
ncbi:MAG: uroporphyrinogen-III synthase [Gammaproteobacteria bacterium]|nr:uroporphyrinogen-III synthase [Gammaproteobacteria bacterium]